LEIIGFKSFAKKACLEFNTNVSAIVGPNGSGKSNVAEAFRFVLGEQSIKSMRGKRGEDLIFNGSQTIPRGNRASVKIIFDNSRRFLDIDFDEVIIERHVHRDGTNQYFINRSIVRLKDISELLSGANIGSSGHHMISQGEADRILNVNLKERRMMIEEALGLKIYQYKRIASEKKLEKVRDNIDSVQTLRKENAPHLRFLRRQIKKMEKTLEMRKELGVLYREYFKREKIYINYWKEKITKDKFPLQEKLKQLEQKAQEAKNILENAQAEDKRPFVLANLKSQLDDLRRERKIKHGDKKGQGRIIQEAKLQAKKFLAKGTDFIWNAPNTTLNIRNGLTSIFYEYQATVHIIYIEVDKKTNLSQNHNRDYQVPEQAIMKLLKTIDIPIKDEANTVKFIIKKGNI